MATAGLYRRLLPSPPATEFGSPDGKMVFREALANGSMEGFFQLIAHFQTQAEPAFCALASLSVVLNALAIDPGRTWKGTWRWIDEAMLECCEPLEKVKVEGMTFAKVACTAICAGASVQAVRSYQSSVDEFRQQVLECCSSEAKHMIVSYDRQILRQTGSGHFSPIGGYHKEKDLVLILDVARFKYPPHWVPLSLLWEAVNTIDPATSKCRGFLVATKPHRPPPVLFTLSCKDELWTLILKYLFEEVPEYLRSADIKNVQEVLSVVLGSLPGSITSFVKWIAEVQRVDTASADLLGEAGLALNAKVRILEELRRTALYSSVLSWSKDACSAGCQCPSLHEEDLTEGLQRACCNAVASLCGMPNGACIPGAKMTVTKSKQVARGRETVVQSVVGGDSKTDLTVGGLSNSVEVFVPTSAICDTGSTCVDLHPASVDMLSVLVFALPSDTWVTIRNESVQVELLDATSVVKLPSNLQMEVENLRQQIRVLHKCYNDNSEEGEAT